MKAGDKLRANYSKKQDDVVLHYPLGQSTVCDARWLSGIFSEEFMNELSKRGYDVATMKFSIEPMLSLIHI